MVVIVSCAETSLEQVNSVHDLMCASEIPNTHATPRSISHRADQYQMHRVQFSVLDVNCRHEVFCHTIEIEHQEGRDSLTLTFCHVDFIILMKIEKVVDSLEKYLRLNRRSRLLHVFSVHLIDAVDQPRFIFLHNTNGDLAMDGFPY